MDNSTGSAAANDWDDWNLDQTNKIDAMVDAYNEEHSHVQEPANMEADPEVEARAYGYTDAEAANLAGEDDFVNDLIMYDADEPMYSDSNNASSGDERNSTLPEDDTIAIATTAQASCQHCGKAGVKATFYGKAKKYCSIACSRAANANKGLKPKSAKRKTAVAEDNASVNGNQAPAPAPAPVSDFSWSAYLGDANADAASVMCFKHVPMFDCWENINVGIKVEVANRDCDLTNEVYWIATVVKIAGYNAKLRYEGFGSDTSHDFWMNLCTEDVHPVGWCATLGKPLVPPMTIQSRYLDWKEFLVKRLTGARTLPMNFYDKVQESIANSQLRPKMRVEVVDKMWVSAMRVARVAEVYCGRCRLQYEASSYDDNDFWIHEKSPLVHYVGWSQAVGHSLHASSDYKYKSLRKLQTNQYSDTDATPGHFDEVPPAPEGMAFEVGMKLEAVDPLNLSAICPATVMKVLKNDNIMIGIDGSMAANGSDWFAFHASSPLIFPVGFCEINLIQLTPPKDFKGPFSWMDYLSETNSMAAPQNLFEKPIPKHGFCVGMKIEAVDLMEPRLICVASIARVVGRLLKIHFDSWEDTFDQWVDCHSPDIYPVGWCEMVGYSLEGPPAKEGAPGPFSAANSSKKKKKVPKPGMTKKRRKKPSLTSKSSSHPLSSSAQSSPPSDNQAPPHVLLPPEQVAATLGPIVQQLNDSSTDGVEH